MQYKNQIAQIKNYLNIRGITRLAFEDLDLDLKLHKNKRFCTELYMAGLRSFYSKSLNEAYIISYKDSELLVLFDFFDMLLPLDEDLIVTDKKNEIVFEMGNLKLFTGITPTALYFIKDVIRISCGGKIQKVKTDNYRKVRGIVKSLLVVSTQIKTEDVVMIEAPVSNAEIVDVEAQEIVSTHDGVVEEVSVDEENIELIPTKDFPIVKLPYDKFNVLQSATFPFWDQPKNVLAAGNTSTGKSDVAVQNIVYALEADKKAIFISPLKSVAQEKYAEWKKLFSNHKVVMATGDSRATKKQLRDADIILMTSEMLDSKTRKPAQNSWLKEVKSLVIDEAHLLTMAGRGDKLEVGLMRFSQINSEAKIVFLSATMPNVNEVGSWMSVLNGKTSAVINTDWRPVDLEVDYLPFDDSAKTAKKRTASKFDAALELLQKHSEDKFLVFVHSKFEGRDLLKKLAEIGIESAFHNANESFANRQKIEASFKAKDGLRVLVSTSTLAWGVNMPARRCIVLGTTIGEYVIDQIDITQMVGRAGRKGIDDKGNSYVFYPASKGYDETIRDIVSVLNDKSVLEFHIIAEILTGTIKTVEDIYSWFGRSLAYAQGSRLNKKTVDSILSRLVKFEAIRLSGSKIYPTVYGNLAAKYYMSSDLIYNWKKNFTHIHNKGLMKSDTALAWALTAGVEDFDLGRVPRGLPIKKYMDECFKLGLTVSDTNSAHGIAVLKIIRDGQKRSFWNSTLSSAMSQFITDADRSFSVLQKIDELSGLGISEELETLRARLKSAIPKHLYALAQVEGIGVKNAKNLMDMGIVSKEDLLDNLNKAAEVLPIGIVNQLKAA